MIRIDQKPLRRCETVYRPGQSNQLPVLGGNHDQVCRYQHPTVGQSGLTWHNYDLTTDLDVNQIINMFITKAGILLLSPRKVFFSVGWTRDSRWAATQEQQGLKGNGL